MQWHSNPVVQNCLLTVIMCLAICIWWTDSVQESGKLLATLSAKSFLCSYTSISLANSHNHESVICTVVLILYLQYCVHISVSSRLVLPYPVLVSFNLAYPIIPRQVFAYYFFEMVKSFRLVGMLLVSRSGLVEEDAIEVFRYYGFHLSSSFLMYNFKSFQRK